MNRLIVADSVRFASGPAGDAVSTQDGLVKAIGAEESLAGNADDILRFPGGVIVPGLVDAHFHPLGYSAAVTGLNLSAARSIQDVLDLIGAVVAKTLPGRSVIGSRLDDQALVEGRFPERADLDRVSPDSPVLIYRYCGHVAVANTAALDLAGIGPNTVNPEGGTLDRDGSGRPNGILRETAISLVSAAVGNRTSNLEPAQLLEAMQGLVSLGIVSMGAIIDLTGDLWCGVGNELDLLLEVAPDLPIRMSVLAITDDPQQLETAAARLSSAGPWVRFLGVKQFADGSFGGHTAAMHAPFTDRTDTIGTLRLTDSTERMARAALAMDASVAIHAIGDRANSEVLDLCERLIEGGADPQRLRIEHASVLTDHDLLRMAQLGITAVIQPAFLMSESEWLESRVGESRLPHTYAFKSMLRAGIPLAGSSDCPVEPPSPLWGMAAARDRAGILMEESLSGAEALHLYTDGAAKAIGDSGLDTGMPADLVVLDRDPVAATPDELRSIEVRAVFRSGDPVSIPAEPLVWTASP